MARMAKRKKIVQAHTKTEGAGIPFIVRWRVTDADGNPLRLPDLLPEYMRHGVPDIPLEDEVEGKTGTVLVTGITTPAGAGVFTAGVRLAVEAEPLNGPRWLAYGLAFAKVEGEPGSPTSIDRYDVPGMAVLRDCREEAVVTLIGEWFAKSGPRMKSALLMISMDLPDGWPHKE